MYEERYNSASGSGEQPKLETLLLSKLFKEVKRNSEVKSQIQGCDYICDGKWVDCKVDYFNSSRDFCFETVGRGGHSWTDSDHQTDYVLYIKLSDREAFLINFETLQKFKLTKIFRTRREFKCGDNARCKFFKLEEELPVEKRVRFKAGKPLNLKSAMANDKKFAEEV